MYVWETDINHWDKGNWRGGNSRSGSKSFQDWKPAGQEVADKAVSRKLSALQWEADNQFNLIKELLKSSVVG